MRRPNARRLRSISGLRSSLLLACLLSPALAACGSDAGGDLIVVGLQAGGCERTEARPVYGQIPVRVALTDGTAVTALSVRVNGSAPLEASSAPFEVVVDTARFNGQALPDGTNRLELTARDGAGETHQTSLEICVDNTPPKITIVSPPRAASAFSDDAGLTVRAELVEAVGMAKLVAKLYFPASGSHPGAAFEKTCTAAPGAIATCTLEPLSTSPALPAGTSLAGTLSVIGKDRAGHETRASQPLTLATRLRWQLTAASRIEQPAAYLTSLDAVAVGTSTGVVHLVSNTAAGPAQRTSIKDWSPSGAGPEEAVTTPLTASETGAVYFGTTEALRCLKASASDLTPCWMQDPRGSFSASQPLLCPARDLLFVGRWGSGADPGSLSAYSAGTGAVVAELKLGSDSSHNKIHSSPASADCETVYIGSTDKNLYAINVSADGKLTKKWSTVTGAEVKTKPYPGEGVIFVAGFDGVLHRMDAATGLKDASASFSAKVPFIGNVVESDGLLYAPDNGGSLYAVDQRGKEAGKHEIGQMALQASPAVGPGKVIYMVSKSGCLYALNERVERVLWSYCLASGVQLNASPIVGGTAPVSVFVGDTKGVLHALDATPPAP